MRHFYLFIIFLISNCSYAQQLSFFDKLDKFDIDLRLPVEQNPNDFHARQDIFARYDAVLSPVECNCEVRYIIQDEYVPGPFLPPHAEMIRLLGSLGSNGTNNILIEQFPEDSDQWSALAHFAPKMEITAHYYGTMSTFYRTDGPLIHIVVFYDGEKKEIEYLLEGNRY